MIAEIREAYRRTRKPQDILWNRFFARPLAAVLVVPFSRTPITPNQVTLLSLAIFVGAAALMAYRTDWFGLLWGVALLQVSYVFDCLDGQLARWRGRSTPVGAHLDFLMDELKAYLLVLAVGLRLWRQDGDPLWLGEGLVTLFALATALSLTGFVRRPEYAAATGQTVSKGAGDYGQGFAGPEVPPARPSPLRRLVGMVEALGRLVVHYPSYIWVVALVDGLPYFLHGYLLVNVAYGARTLLAIIRGLGVR